MIQYTDHSLIVEIPDVTAAAYHEQLIKSIASIIRMAALCPDEDRRKNEMERIVPLIALLEAVTPEERELSKGYGEK